MQQIRSLRHPSSIIDYGIDLGKLSATGRFYVDAQMAVSFCNRQIMPGVSFIITQVAYSSTKKARIV